MRRKLLSSVAMLAALSVATFAVPYANANAGSKIYICTTPQASDLNQAAYEALSWIEIKGIGELGETGTSTNILTYDTWDTDVADKAKGISDAGSPTLEVARIPTDPGQIALKAAAATNLKYAIKVVRNDPAVVGGVGTVRYNRGIIAGPTNPNGRNEDFDLEVYTFGLVQKQLEVNPGAGGNPPVVTAAPALTGTFTVGQVINLSNGTWTGDATIVYTYQWFANGVAIAGATANTYTLTSAELGKKIQARVHASNLSGSAQSWTTLSTAVA